MKCGKIFTLCPTIIYRNITSIMGGCVCIYTGQLHLIHTLKSLNIEYDYWDIMISFFTGFISGIFIAPYEHIMVQKTMGNPNTIFSIASQATKSIPQLNHLYKGASIISLRLAIPSLSFFSLCPTCNQKLEKYTGNTAISTAGSGIICGIFSAVLTNPLDRIATELQTHHTSLSDIITSKKSQWYMQHSGPRILRSAITLPIISYAYQTLQTNK